MALTVHRQHFKDCRCRLVEAKHTEIGVCVPRTGKEDQKTFGQELTLFITLFPCFSETAYLLRREIDKTFNSK